MYIVIFPAADSLMEKSSNLRFFLKKLHMDQIMWSMPNI